MVGRLSGKGKNFARMNLRRCGNDISIDTNPVLGILGKPRRGILSRTPHVESTREPLVNLAACPADPLQLAPVTGRHRLYDHHLPY